MSLDAAVDSVASRRVVLFGGKGGVGKTTISALAALHVAQTRPVILFTTDPASNLHDIFEEPVVNLTIEQLSAEALYARFLEQHLDAFLEIGDRGTYLERDELRRLMQLALPGIDELMAWMRIGELAEAHPESLVIVDTAPTGHTLRMLASGAHFRQLATALDTMQEKHRSMVRQFTRRDVRDALDAFIEDFDARARARRELLLDPARAAFVPVFLSEPWVVEQTIRLMRDIEIDVPFAVLNRAVISPDCERDVQRAQRDDEAMGRVGVPVVKYARQCEPMFRSAAAEPPLWIQSGGSAAALLNAPLLFLAGKGGVGKTSSAASIALQRAQDGKPYVLISVDPAHSVVDVFAHEPPPPNLTVETIDTPAKWERFRAGVGAEIEKAIDALTPRGLSVAYDGAAMKQLLDIAPPGADELFAVIRLAKLFADESLAGVIVDTAPTGHFLRLLDLPHSAGEWVRELMRLFLRYKELIPPGSLGEELLNASRALKELQATLQSDRTQVIVVTRPERVVVAETRRLIDELQQRGVHVGGVIANYVTPENDCTCDRTTRAYELGALAALPVAPVVIERRDEPVTHLAGLRALVPLS